MISEYLQTVEVAEGRIPRHGLHGMSLAPGSHAVLLHKIGTLAGQLASVHMPSPLLADYCKLTHNQVVGDSNANSCGTTATSFRAATVRSAS